MLGVFAWTQNDHISLSKNHLSYLRLVRVKNTFVEKTAKMFCGCYCCDHAAFDRSASKTHKLCYKTHLLRVFRLSF